MSAGNGILLLEGLIACYVKVLGNLLGDVCHQECGFVWVLGMLCCGHFMAIRRIRYPVTVDWEEHFQDVQSVECS